MIRKFRITSETVKFCTHSNGTIKETNENQRLMFTMYDRMMQQNSSLKTWSI